MSSLLKSLKNVHSDDKQSFTIERANPNETDETKENTNEKLKCSIVFEQQDKIKSSAHLEQFHTAFEQYHEAILQRYGWSPKCDNRIANDSKAYCLAFAVTENDDIAGLLSLMEVDADEAKELFNYNEATQKQFNLNDFVDGITLFDEEDESVAFEGKYYELAMAVLPPFQRCGIASNLVTKTWRRIGNKNTQWIAIINSIKSKRFLENVKNKFSYIPVNVLERQ
eukprot:698177_1